MKDIAVEFAEKINGALYSDENNVLHTVFTKGTGQEIAKFHGKGVSFYHESMVERYEKHLPGEWEREGTSRHLNMK